MRRPRLVVGVGHDFRGDDAAGLEVARRVGAAGLPSLELRGDLSALVELGGEAEEVIVVDAMRSGAVPGTVRRFDASGAPLPARWAQGSTHAFGLAEAVELARALGRLPPLLIVLGIEASDTAPGQGLSPSVAEAVDALSRRLQREGGSGR